MTLHQRQQAPEGLYGAQSNQYELKGRSKFTDLESERSKLISVVDENVENQGLRKVDHNTQSITLLSPIRNDSQQQFPTLHTQSSNLSFVPRHKIPSKRKIERSTKQIRVNFGNH